MILAIRGVQKQIGTVRTTRFTFSFCSVFSCLSIHSTVGRNNKAHDKAESEAAPAEKLQKLMKITELETMHVCMMRVFRGKNNERPDYIEAIIPISQYQIFVQPEEHSLRPRVEDVTDN